MAPPRPDQDVIDISDDDSDGEVEAWGTPASSPRLIPVENEMEVDDMRLPSTEQDCLDKALELFPDVSHAHVRLLYTEAAVLPAERWCLRVVEQLIESAGKYPKEERKPDRKRKREDGIDPDELRKWEQADRVMEGHAYSDAALKILSDEFVAIPVAHIRRVVREERTIFRAFQVLEKQQLELDSGMSRPFKRLASIRLKGSRSSAASSEITAELAAAKKKRDQEERERREKAAMEEAERQNEIDAMQEGLITACGCCFVDTPINRTIPCDSDEEHLFCYACAKQNVATEIGKGKCRPQCMDQSGCKAGFPRAMLQRVLEPKTFDRLERMQQQEDITLAKLEGLESCPFCDYKAVLPPVHIDREFRCGNNECEKVTCRLCKEATHIPKTCEEAKKEKAIDKRHLVEEASTEAVIRVCNNCKNRFIKDVGCNKMTCPSCAHVQCYVCSKTIRNYDHYGPGRCPLYDNTDARHQDEVKRAEAAAMAKIRADNPDIAEDDLKVKVSDRVQRAEAARVQQAQMRLPNPQPPPPGFVAVPPPHHHLLHHHPHAAPAAAIPPHAFVPPLYPAFVMPGGHGMPVHVIHPVAAAPAAPAPAPAHAAPAAPLHHHHHHLPQAPAAPAAPPTPGGAAAPAPAAAAAPAAAVAPAAHPQYAVVPPFAHHGHAHHGVAAPPLFAPMGGPGDAIGARVGAALGQLYAANARVQHELQVAERQLAEQRARVQRWQDDIARYELEARRRRRHL